MRLAKPTVVFITLLVAALATPAFAQRVSVQAPPPGSVIYACVPPNGQFRLSTATELCQSGEAGPAGPAGPASVASSLTVAGLTQIPVTCTALVAATIAVNGTASADFVGNDLVTLEYHVN